MRIQDSDEVRRFLFSTNWCNVLRCNMKVEFFLFHFELTAGKPAVLYLKTVHTQMMRNMHLPKLHLKKNERKNHLEELGVDGKMVKQTLNKSNLRMWTGVM